jgi:hypothetical protein
LELVILAHRIAIAALGISWPLIACGCGDGVPALKLLSAAPTVSTAPIDTDTPRPSDVGAESGCLEELSSADSDAKLIEIAGVVMPKPPSWQWQTPIGSFRTLQYSVPTRAANTSAAELSISVFRDGDGGSIELNLQRWCSQFVDADGTPVHAAIGDRTVHELAIKVVELKGLYQGVGQAAPRPDMMLLGAIVAAPGRTLYIRLIGQTATVEYARERFELLVNGMRPAE